MKGMINNPSFNRPVILIFPPPAYPERPALSLASLAGFLRQKGVKVFVEDFNVEAYHYLLKSERLDYYADLIEKKLLSPRIPDDWKLKTLRTLSAREYLRTNLEPSLNLLRHKTEYYDPRKRKRALDTVQAGLKMVSAAHFPVKWGWGSFKCGFRSDNSSEIIEAAHTPSSTPFTEFFQQKVKNDILTKDPLLVGISINYQDQIIPAFRLLKIIKESLPNVSCVIGGAIFTRLAGELTKTPRFFSICDYFIIDEGETALWFLYQALTNRKNLMGAVPNLIYKKENQVVRNHAHVEDLKKIPSPSFEGFPWDKYLLPEKVLQLETTRGCYWRKCNFCSLPRINFKRIHRTIPPGKLVETIERLTAEHAAKWITFWDEAVPPATLKQLCLQLIEKKISIQWQAVVRLDGAFKRGLLELMANAGCRALSFGLESAHPRVLGLINKNIKLDNVLEIIKNCKKLDIHVHINWFVGFPGETAAEAESTCNFLLEHLKNNEYAWFPALFSIYKHSNIQRRPEKFGVKILKDPKADLPLIFDYMVESGMSPQEADDLRESFLKRFKKMKLTADESEFDCAYLLYQSYYRKKNPPFTFHKPTRLKLDEYVKGGIKPVLAKGLGREKYKLLKKGREIEMTVIFSPGKCGSAIIQGDSDEVDFWVREVDGIKTLTGIKKGFQQRFGPSSGWLKPYIYLIEQGIISVTDQNPKGSI